MVFIESIGGGDGSIVFFVIDVDAEYDRCFDACFCGNGKCIYSPFGKVILIICDDDESVIICDEDVSISFGEYFVGNPALFDDNFGQISWQLNERPQGLNR